MKILPISFYHKDTLEVAKGLIGCFLVRRIGRKALRARIVETEGYVGENDLACHASKGRTKRTETMYGEAGHAYVYMIYGMYHCLNIVTEAEGFPAAVLIRGLAEPEEWDVKNCKWKSISLSSVSMTRHLPSGRGEGNGGGISLDGPGKLCRFLEIDRELDGWDVTRGQNLWLERPSRKLRIGETIIASERIGIDYAGHCREYPWRFVLTRCGPPSSVKRKSAPA